MREIKFRGKARRDGQWFYGNYYDRDTRGCTHIGNLNSGCLDIDPETVGQYTGLKDKNGKEIYEGDILYVEFCDGSNATVLIGWNKRWMCWGCMDKYTYQSIAAGYDSDEYFKGYILKAYLEESLICKVAGNIHDNPGLIKK